jgi:hypothetical protein
MTKGKSEALGDMVTFERGEHWWTSGHVQYEFSWGKKHPRKYVKPDVKNPSKH